MHEVSFKDKEKEHLTLLQDAEEMKVILCDQFFTKSTLQTSDEGQMMPSCDAFLYI